MLHDHIWPIFYVFFSKISVSWDVIMYVSRKTRKATLTYIHDENPRVPCRSIAFFFSQYDIVHFSIILQARLLQIFSPRISSSK